MADTGGDSEDSPGRVPQEWEVISGSIMSGMCVPSSFSAGASMDGSTFLMASDMNTAGGVSSGVDFSLVHSQHFMVPSSEQLDENPASRAGSGTKASQSPGVSVSDPHGTSQVEDPGEGRGLAQSAPKACGKDWIDPVSIHLVSSPSSVPVGAYRAANLTLSEISLGSGLNSGGEGGAEISYPCEGLGLASVPVPPAVAASVASVASHSGVKDEHVLWKGGAELDVDHAEEVEAEPTFVLQEGQEKVLFTRTGQSFHSDDGADLVPVKEEDAVEDVPELLDEKNCVSKSDVQYTCDGWWKRRVAQCFVQAKQANTLWSLALAAAVMGLVILGQRWQHERYQNQQLRLQLCSRDDRISRLLHQVKELSERRRVRLLRPTSYGGLLN